MKQIKSSREANLIFRQIWEDPIELYESFYILFLNKGNKVIGYRCISRGGVSGTTEKIIENLEKAGSWKQMWHVPTPVSLAGHLSRGVKRMLLYTDPYKSRVYGTFKQIRQNGGTIRKGEHATIIVFWSRKEKRDTQTGEMKMTFLVKYYYIFNTEQADFDAEGAQKIERMNHEIYSDHDLFHMGAQEIVDEYPNPPAFEFSDRDDE